MNTVQQPKFRVLVPIRYPVGGIRTYIKYTLSKLNRDQYQFDLVGPSKEWLDRIKEDLSELEVHVYPTSNRNEFRDLLFDIIKLLRSKNYQIIHSQGYTAGILSNLANIVHRVPHIITLHHVFGHGQFSDTFWDGYTPLKRLMIYFLLSFADKIQTVSDDAMNNFLQYFPGMRKQRKKLITIRNGIDTIEFLGGNAVSENSFEKKPGVIYLGFLGRYMPEKGFPFIIDMIDKITRIFGRKDFCVVTVGGFGGFIREYKKEIEKRGLSDYFIFIDFKERVAPIIKMFDILLIPSLGEACPLVPMEGLICGTPIVAFSCIGLREVLKSTPAKMVPVGDSNKLVDAILEVSDSLEKTKNEYTDFIPEAIERFDVEKTAVKLNSLYNELLSKKATTANLNW